MIFYTIFILDYFLMLIPILLNVAFMLLFKNLKFIFIAEYASIYFLSMISIVLCLGMPSFQMSTQILTFFLIFFWMWTRSTLPRFRYDFLMTMAWKSILPLTLSYLEILLIIIMI